MNINGTNSIGQNNQEINSENKIQTYKSLNNFQSQKDEFVCNYKNNKTKSGVISKFINSLIAQVISKDKPVGISIELPPNNTQTMESLNELNKVDKDESENEVSSLIGNEYAIDNESLTDEDREKMLLNLELTQQDYDNLSKNLKDVDDKTFKRSVILIKNGAKFNTYQKYDSLSELDDEQFKRALQITKAGNSPIYIENTCKVAHFDDLTYSRVLKFKENGGELIFNSYEPYLEKFIPEQFAQIDDTSYNNALNLIPVLKKSNYILSVVSDDSYHKKVQKVINTENFCNKAETYQNRQDIFHDLSKEDDKTIDKLCELLNNGLIITKGHDLTGSNNLSKLRELSDEQYKKSLYLLKNHGVSQLYNLLNIARLEDEKYNKAVKILNDGIPNEQVLYLTKMDDEIYEQIINTIAKGVDPKTINGYQARNLTQKDFERINELIDLGVKSFVVLQSASTLDEEEYEKAKKLISVGLPGYDFRKKVSLSDEEFEKELEKINHIASGLEFNQNSEEINNEQLYKFNDEEIKEILNLLTKNNVYIQSSEKNSVESLANAWRNKYITGINVLDGYEDKIIPYALNRYKSKNCAPMARWMQVNNIDNFIKNFPNEGEIYQYDKIMSFAKTLYGAERIRGNNFSDENPCFNVKFVVYPKEELTQAYDTGEAKYGNDESIYKPNQQFKVLYKGFENVENHELYTVYMQEV